MPVVMEEPRFKRPRLAGPDQPDGEKPEVPPRAPADRTGADGAVPAEVPIIEGGIRRDPSNPGLWDVARNAARPVRYDGSIDYHGDRGLERTLIRFDARHFEVPGGWVLEISVPVALLPADSGPLHPSREQLREVAEVIQQQLDERFNFRWKYTGDVARFQG
ncbi:MAG: hypothetical protein DIU77_018610, partial [Thermocrispum agreste]